MLRNGLSTILTTAGLLTGTGAVFSAWCCVLPLALGGLGAVASAFAVLGAISDYRHCDTSAVLVATWYVCLERRGAIGTVVALSAAIVLVGTVQHGAIWNAHVEASGQPGNAITIDPDLSRLRTHNRRNHANRRVPVFLRLCGLRNEVEAQSRRLLRVLLLRQPALSAHSKEWQGSVLRLGPLQ